MLYFICPTDMPKALTFLSSASTTRLKLASLWAVMVLSLVIAPCNGAENIEIAEILDAWKSRAANVNSLRILWQETDVPGPGILNRFSPSRAKSQFGPDYETKIPLLFSRKVTYELLVKNEKVSLDSDGDSIYRGERIQKQFRTAFNGTVSKSLKTLSSHPVPQGTISAEDGFAKTRKATLQPILSVVTPFEVCPHESLELTSRVAVINNRECLVLRQTRPGVPSSIRYLYVDPMLGFSIVRAELKQAGAISHVTEVEYKLTSGIPLPTHWVCIGYSLGTNEREIETEVAVMKCELNMHINDSEFDIELPDNCFVADERKGTIVRERNGDSETIATFASAKPASEDGNGRLGQIIANIAVVVVLSLLVYWRRRCISVIQ